MNIQLLKWTYGIEMGLWNWDGCINPFEEIRMINPRVGEQQAIPNLTRNPKNIRQSIMTRMLQLYHNKSIVESITSLTIFKSTQ